MSYSAFPLPDAPLVNGRPTKLVQVNRADLDTSSLYLVPFADMVNLSFEAGCRQPVMAPTQRLTSHEQLLHELEPGITIFLLVSRDDPGKVLASVCTEPCPSYLPGTIAPDPRDGHVWIPDPAPHNAREPRWTIKLLCVSPEAQKHGLGTWLMQVAEDAVRHSVRQQRANPEDDQVAEDCESVRLVIVMVRENNGVFYGNRGWTEIQERPMKPGFLGSEGGFTIVVMDKMLRL
ncbi:hypothetical protein BKA62DRAFT_79447 [Auriculariales sp. MPI-PUGE-AT-0066]|nr:hypothetical protein BKA62DRAFT_79447 [Auriculariales sp. MPI-PUGE-AT-0066]